MEINILTLATDFAMAGMSEHLKQSLLRSDRNSCDQEYAKRCITIAKTIAEGAKDVPG